MSEPKQNDLFSDPEILKAELTWFHILRTMIHSEEFAKMEASSVKVYLVIKAHTNINTGDAFPGIPIIAEKSGYSVPQVHRILKDLLELKLIAKRKVGRHNSYMLRESVEIFNEAGQATALATFDYQGANVTAALADLKNVIVSGQLGNARIVHIERLQINVNNVSGNAVNFNVQEFINGVEKLPKHMRARAREAMDRADLGEKDEKDEKGDASPSH